MMNSDSTEALLASVMETPIFQGGAQKITKAAEGTFQRFNTPTEGIILLPEKELYFPSVGRKHRGWGAEGGTLGVLFFTGNQDFGART